MAKNDIQEEAKSSPIPQAGFVFEEAELSLEKMLKAGMHFGHKNSRWNPKMKPYIFGVRNNIHIIDLEKSQHLFKKALEFMENVAKNGGKILFVGTKPQARKLTEQAAIAVDMPYVNNRWLGGTFSNFPQIKKRLKYLIEQEGKLARNEFEKYTKYEQLMFKKEIDRMNEKMGGLKKMENIPQAIFVTDMKENELAVKEALIMKVPVVAIVDTNVDPEFANFPIPGNDDAVSSLKYILSIIVKTVADAKSHLKTSSGAAFQGEKKQKAENAENNVFENRKQQQEK